MRTVHLLGSVNVATAVSVVKGLVDNAIDARATSIEIIISLNTVDKIQVTDNGCGIRRASTSKIQDFDDLARGVQTMGFRGGALANLNCDTGEVTVKTRAVEDINARTWQFRPSPGVGGAEGPQIKPGPVGTAVMVTDLFAVIPVRRQQAVKESSNLLA